jgi:hypothetical protein
MDIMNFIFESELISNTWKYCKVKVATCEGVLKSYDVKKVQDLVAYFEDKTKCL